MKKSQKNWISKIFISLTLRYEVKDAKCVNTMPMIVIADCHNADDDDGLKMKLKFSYPHKPQNKHQQQTNERMK